jgi:hypothetical protein
MSHTLLTSWFAHFGFESLGNTHHLAPDHSIGETPSGILAPLHTAPLSHDFARTHPTHVTNSTTVARVAKAMGMDVIAYTASPRLTPESKRDDGFIVPGTGDPEGEFPSAWYSGTDKESLHKFLGQDIDLLVLAVPLT